MNAYQRSSTRSSRPKHPLELGTVFWGGSLVAGGLLLGILYCLLTHQIPL